MTYSAQRAHEAELIKEGLTIITEDGLPARDQFELQEAELWLEDQAAEPDPEPDLLG